MANIPIASIPNAPQTGNGAVLTDPSGIRAPNFRRGAGMIAEGASMLRQEKLPAAAFDTGGMGAGLEALGNAGSNAAAAFGDFAVRLGRANDEAQMAELDAIKTDLLSRFEEESLTKPADQWANIWSKYDAQLVDKASKLPMSSSMSSGRRDAAVKSLRLQTSAEVRSMANKRRVDSYRNTLTAQMERHLVNDDVESAEATNAKMFELGLIDEGQREKNSTDIFKVNKQRADEAMWGNIESEILAHSRDAKAEDYYSRSADLEEALASKTYESKFFPELNGEPAALKKALLMSKDYERDGMIDRMNEAVTRVAAGEFGTEDELREEYGEALDESGFDKLRATWAQSPEEQSKRLAQRPQLITAIDLYDPASDPESKDFDRLLSWVHTMPAGFQADLSQMLRDKKKDAQPKPSTAIEAIKQRSREMFTLGKYGPIKSEEDWQAAKTRQSREIDTLNSWAAANPREAADATKVTAQYNEIRTKIYQEDMADGVAEMPKPETLKPPTLDPRRVLEDPRLRDESESPLDAAQLPLGDGSWQVTPQTRDQIKTSSRAGQRQVSLDFNSGASTSRGVEIVIPHDATPDERAAAQAYVDKTVAWYRSKGIEVPAGRVLSKTGKGASVSRFHTEPFYVQDAGAMAVVQGDPDGYAAILEDTLGRLSGVTFIAPHKTDDGGAQNDQINERDFARNYLVPALQRRKGGEPTTIAQNE